MTLEHPPIPRRYRYHSRYPDNFAAHGCSASTPSVAPARWTHCTTRCRSAGSRWTAVGWAVVLETRHQTWCRPGVCRSSDLETARPRCWSFLCWAWREMKYNVCEMRKTSRNPKNHETLVKKGTNGKKSLVEDIWKNNFKAVFSLGCSDLYKQLSKNENVYYWRCTKC